jgi:hypothetical protein
MLGCEPSSEMTEAKCPASQLMEIKMIKGLATDRKTFSVDGKLVAGLAVFIGIFFVIPAVILVSIADDTDLEVTRNMVTVSAGQECKEVVDGYKPSGTSSPQPIWRRVCNSIGYKQVPGDEFTVLNKGNSSVTLEYVTFNNKPECKISLNNEVLTTGDEAEIKVSNSMMIEGRRIFIKRLLPDTCGGTLVRMDLKTNNGVSTFNFKYD